MASILKVDTIQDQDGNNIINESANTITIGASGNTITIPSGATLANSGIVTGFQSTGIDDNATSTAITIDSSENVGIGTSNPLQKLHVTGSTAISSSGATFYYNSDATNSFFVGSNTGASGTGNAILRFQETGVGERMRIDSSGNVGIGTSSPANPLHLSSTSYPQFAIQNSTSTYRMGVDSNFKLIFDPISSSTRNIIFQNSGTGVINVGIGTSSPATSLDIRSTNGTRTTGGVTYNLGARIRPNDEGGLDIGSTSTDILLASMVDNGDIVFGTRFTSQNLERMRIEAGGNVLIGSTSAANYSLSTGNGFTVTSASRIWAAVDGDFHIFNRTSSDGTIIQFRQAGTEEGSISVSGATVSYNGFTGTHWSRFTDNSKPTILRGTVLESLDEMCDWYNLEFDVTTQDADGNDVTTTEKVPHVLTDTQSVGDTVIYNHEGTDYQATIVKEADIKHMKSKVSDTVDAKNVYGVFSAYDLDGEGYNDFYVASVGSFVVRIKANETIAKGDLLQSNGDGTAKVQTDDAVRSSSFAKVLSTTIIETYEDGSYLVPCSLMC
jgi:hypothetical protein